MGSEAAGTYTVKLTRDAGITSQLNVQFGPDVRIISGTPATAAAPIWGGGITSKRGGSLMLVGVEVAGTLAAETGSGVTATGGSLPAAVTVQNGATMTIDDICSEAKSRYKTVDRCVWKPPFFLTLIVVVVRQ